MRKFSSDHLRVLLATVAAAAALLTGCEPASNKDSAALKKDQVSAGQLSQIINGLNATASISVEAFATLKSIRQKYPQAPEVRETYKNALIVRSDWGALETLLTENPVDKMPVKERELLGKVYMKAGKLESAAAILKSLATESPNNLEVRSMLAGSYNLLGRYDEAGAEIDAVWERVLSERHVDSIIVRGSIFVNQNQLAKAEAAFVKALELAPDNSETTNNLSRLYGRLGNVEKAEVYRKKTTELHKKAGEAELLALRRVEKIYAIDNAWKAKNFSEVIRIANEMLPTTDKANEKIILYQYLYESNKALGNQNEAQSALAEAQKLQQQK
ncbi:MAG: tetratricopeptide repeat protein [Acidobacteria bacterium]|nr:tetratricopeptide repeat protein [Acidobacteriota bacterium]MBK8148453.1 tetratricopeptide repeat protein [Acidobacteriota bacterium]